MKSREIISKINSYLHEATQLLATSLDFILPRVSGTWWQDCVLSSLSYSQREYAISKGFTKLSDFDLAALLRIANKSWYEMRTVAYMPTKERERIREMISIRNTWAHCGSSLPGKDSIIYDLKTIQSFIRQVNGPESICNDIDELISYVERPDSMRQAESTNHASESSLSLVENQQSTQGNIVEKSLVYLVSSPDKKGIVFSVSPLSETIKYEVFIDGLFKTYYKGQIALVDEPVEYHWMDIDTFRNYLSAYHINNPSANNLYSLNSARIDFVPYQFRPALKIIRSDEPRILIADSVGVGKTIEAGLIIKELEARSDIERILIICPRPLVAERKWELEMKRFDEDFIPLDGSTLRRIISDTDRDGQWPTRYNKVIIPYSILDSRVYFGETQKRNRSFGLTELDPSPRFDLVIIDEAHHIRNGSMEKDKAFAYKCVKHFCDNAEAVIMLTATPLQTSDTDLFTLLNVLRPDIVIDQKSFDLMSRPNEHISKTAHIIRSANKGWATAATQELVKIRKTQWGDNVISENPLYGSILNRLENRCEQRDERIKLLSDVESLHSFSTMINRTRRKDIQDFCVRRTHTVSSVFTSRQRELHDELLVFEHAALSILHDARSVPFMMSTIKRQAASCIFGLAPHIRAIINKRFQQLNDDPELESDVFVMDSLSSNTLFSLANKVLSLADTLPDEDPKFDKTLKIIMQKQAQENNKIMLFSTFRHTLAYLKKRLSSHGLRVGQVDGSVKDEQRYILKERFELSKVNPNAIDILLFTEVGSEGLDYQFCDLMINYDLPWNPMRIEQRIGRIDRRGQLSEVVNIYNVITEGTVDAEIYYRCLARIGIFEKNIGECETILGKIASQIESIAVNAKLSDAERIRKLEQIADNEVREIQELNRLEEEEKEFFGFDLSEFTTAQEIRNAENPWLTQKSLQMLIEQYFKDRIVAGASIIGEGAVKNLRLSATARGILRDDAKKLPGNRNTLRRSWEDFLGGKTPNHPITFNPEAAEKNRGSFFITSMHPLSRQAAYYYSDTQTAYLRLSLYSDTVPQGQYIFSMYAWKYIGLNEFFKLITVCQNEIIANELPDMLETATILSDNFINTEIDWSELDEKHYCLWKSASDKHKASISSTAKMKLEILENTFNLRIRRIEQQINDNIDDAIRRMHMGELESVHESHSRKVLKIQSDLLRADIHATLLANGIIVVKKG